MADKKVVKSKKTIAKKATEVKTIDQLKDELTTALSDLLQARRGNAASELTNPHLITVTRKKIARLHSAIWSTETKASGENS